jgi:hypothetical protein
LWDKEIQSPGMNTTQFFSWAPVENISKVLMIKTTKVYFKAGSIILKAFTPDLSLLNCFS